MATRRPQVEGFDSRLPGLSPRASASFSPAAAPRPRQGPSRLEQLSAALAQWQRPMTQALDQKREADTEAAEAAISQMSAAEIRKELEAQGLPEWKSPYFQTAFKRLAGAQIAAYEADRLESELQYNPEQFGDDTVFDQILADRVKESLGEIGQDEDVAAGYAGVMRERAAQLRDAHSDQFAERLRDEAAEKAFDGFRIKAETLLRSGASAQEIHKALREEYKPLKENLNVPYQMLDATMAELGAYFAAKGEVELVDEIWDNKRGGVGSLGKTRKYAAEAEKQKLAARNARQEANQETYSQGLEDLTVRAENAEGTYEAFEADVRAHRGQFDQLMTEAKLQSLLATWRRNKEAQLEAERDRGKALTNAQLKRAAILDHVQEMWDKGVEWGVSAAGIPYEDKDGQPQVVDREEAIRVGTELMEQHFAKLRDDAVARGVPEEEAERALFERRVRLWGSRNDTNPEWEGRLNAAVQWLSSVEDPTRFNEQDRARITDSAELYVNLYRQNPAMAQRHTKSRNADDFMEAYRIGREHLRLEPNEAMNHAHGVMIRNGKLTDTERRENIETLRLEVQRVVDPNLIRRAFGAEGVDNHGTVQKEIQSTAARLMSGGGLGHEQAIELAVEDVKKRGFVVNGWWSASRYSHPENLQDLFAAYQTSDAAEEIVNTAALEGVEDLALRPMQHRPDAFEVISKELHGLRPVGVVTVEELQQTYQEVLNDDLRRAAYEELRRQSRGIEMNTMPIAP